MMFCYVVPNSLAFVLRCIYVWLWHRHRHRHQHVHTGSAECSSANVNARSVTLTMHRLTHKKNTSFFLLLWLIWLQLITMQLLLLLGDRFGSCCFRQWQIAKASSFRFIARYSQIIEFPIDSFVCSSAFGCSLMCSNAILACRRRIESALQLKCSYCMLIK